jgi:hypothetical protein
MDDTMVPQDESALLRREISQAGMTVIIEASRQDRGQWLLRVYGKEGQLSEWLETFSCSEEAVAAACTAIRYEGIDDFYDDPALS